MAAAYVTFDGERVKLAELCRRFGIDRQTVAYRLRKGMTLRLALTEPRRSYPAGVTRGAAAGHTVAPADAPEPQVSPWLKAIEDATNVRLAQGPVTDEAVGLIVEMMSIIDSRTTARQRLLHRARVWLQRVGWQR
jgi:hypothetical protein